MAPRRHVQRDLAREDGTALTAFFAGPLIIWLAPMAACRVKPYFDDEGRHDTTNCAAVFCFADVLTSTS